ncbi:MAG: gamma-glutamylcyclotransferase, partial [Gammaproteobacteria bacterium]
MDSLYYFAYGSNMSPARLQARVPSARPLGVYRLKGHRLSFHKRG